MAQLDQINQNDQNVNTPGANSDKFNVGQWCDDNKLGKIKANILKSFTEDDITMEEILAMEKDELNEYCEELKIKIIYKKRFKEAVAVLKNKTQQFNNNDNDNNCAISITKEEEEAFNKIHLEHQTMIKLINNVNNSILKSMDISFKKCENDINNIFNKLINSIKIQQSVYQNKLKQIKTIKLLAINKQKNDLNQYINKLKIFKDEWNKQILINQQQQHASLQPGQNINDRKQKIILKSNNILNYKQNIDLDFNKYLNINFNINNNSITNINKYLLNIGNINANNPPKSPNINIIDITDKSIKILFDFSKYDKQSFPSKYTLQIAEIIKGNNDQKAEEKEGNIDDDNTEYINWNDVVSNNNISFSKEEYVINNLKYSTKYLLRCKCLNKSGWSKYCKEITVITKEKSFNIDSVILINKSEIELLYSKILVSKLRVDVSNLNVSLLFRGTRDGFSADSFHKLCDGKKKTIVIIESSDGNIFGGYTKIGWSMDNKWHSDGTSFLFLLKDAKNINNNNNCFRIYPIKQSHIDKAVKHYSGHGPCFGKGHDLLIVNACNKSDSRSDGESFINLKGNILTGSTKQIYNKYWQFIVKDFEVFQIL